MANLNQTPLPQDAEIACGYYAHITALHKFGRNTDIDTTTLPEDLWDGGGVWVAPTQARVHAIASTSVNDTAAGTGARTVRVIGLPGWDREEVSEIVEMNGTGSVNTVNSYVIIYRMQVVTAGTGGYNDGDITATAATDGTVTAQITAGFGQTLMAIFGIPSSKRIVLTQWHASIARQNITTAADISLLVNPAPDVNLDLFNIRQTFSTNATGTSSAEHTFTPPVAIPGPAIILMQVEGVSSLNSDISGGFDGYVMDK